MSTPVKLALAPSLVPPAALPVALPGRPGTSARIAVSVHDKKVLLDNGVVKVAANPPRCTVAIIDMTTMPPRLLDETNAPTGVAGTARSHAVHVGGMGRSSRC